MQKTVKKKKGRRIVIAFIIIIVLLIISIQLSFVIYFDSSVRNRLQKEFFIQSKGVYELRIKNFKTNLLNQSVYMSGFQVIPVKGQRTDQSKYFCSAAKINLIDFNLVSFITKDELNFEGIEIDSPKVIIFRNNPDKKTKVDTLKSNKFSLFKLIKPFVNSLSIENIHLSNSNIAIYENENDSSILLKSKNNELIISKLKINQAADLEGRLFIAEKTELSIRQFAFTTANKQYTIRIEKVFASYSDSAVVMDGLQLIPNYSKQAFSEKAGEQIDRFDITASKIAFRKMDVKLFFEKTWFKAKEMIVDNLILESYRDKNFKRQIHFPLTVQTLISSIPVLVQIDSILLKNALCTYEEKQINSGTPAKIAFHKLNASITGFTNNPTENAEKKNLVVNFNCRLLDKAKLTLRYSFPRNTEEMSFDCSGHLSSLPFSELNCIFRPITTAAFVDGTIDSMRFDFHAGEHASSGTMKLAYHDLKVQLYKKNKALADEDNFLSFIANHLLIKTENPSGNRPLRVTEIYTLRDNKRFVFNYTLKSLLSGIKPAIFISYKKIKR